MPTKHPVLLPKSFIQPLFLLLTLIPIQSKIVESDMDYDDSDNLDFRETVSDGKTYPYMATITRSGTYVSCGALIHENWVLSSAEGAESMRESLHLLRVRLGSINYKRGGTLYSVKLIEIHPNYNSTKPGFDLALFNLARSAKFAPTLRSIKPQTTPEEVAATHFIVTSWPGPLEMKLRNTTELDSLDVIKRNRMLTVLHLHPTTPEECNDELMGVNATVDGIMCLEAPLKNPCLREYGAPVVLNNVLWGIISSWKPSDCEDVSYAPSILATLVSEGNVSTWLHTTVYGHNWTFNDV